MHQLEWRTNFKRASNVPALFGFALHRAFRNTNLLWECFTLHVAEFGAGPLDGMEMPFTSPWSINAINLEYYFNQNEVAYMALMRGIRSNPMTRKKAKTTLLGPSSCWRSTSVSVRWTRH